MKVRPRPRSRMNEHDEAARELPVTPAQRKSAIRKAAAELGITPEEFEAKLAKVGTPIPPEMFPEVDWEEPPRQSDVGKPGRGQETKRPLVAALMQRPGHWAVWEKASAKGYANFYGYWGPRGIRFSQKVRSDGKYDVWAMYDPARDRITQQTRLGQGRGRR